MFCFLLFFFFQISAVFMGRIALLEYVLQYHELTSQRNHIYNRDAFGSLIMSYLCVSKNTAQEITVVCIMAFCQNL